jgi:hypothetical protein
MLHGRRNDDGQTKFFGRHCLSWTGSFHTLMCTVSPRHEMSRGSPTFTDYKRPVS